MAMKDYCPSCGEKLDSDYSVCPHCGQTLVEEPSDVQGSNTHPLHHDAAFPWGLIGFIIPLLGLVLFLVWKEERPIASKAAGTGALVNVVVLTLIVMFLATAAGSMMGAYIG